MSSRRKSYKQNKKRWCTQFKKGHNFNKEYSSKGTELLSEPQINTACTYPEIKTVRPSAEEYLDACRIVDSDETVNHELLCPTRLRPKTKQSELDYTKSNEETKEENVIVNFDKLSSLVAGFQHTCKRPFPVVKLEKRKGLCITARTCCKNCKFNSQPCELFTSIKKKRGPTAGSLNDALAIPVLKSKMGVTDIRYLLSCINVQSPAPSGLHRKVCQAADEMVNLNSASMSDNQRYVERVMEVSGRKHEVNVETDLSFNNRPQSGYEAATQSFCPMVEQDTDKKLVLSMATANKLCSKKNCNHQNIKCKKNFGTAESISSSESKLVHQNLESIDGSGIVKVKSLTSDASTQIDKSLRSYAQVKRRNIPHFKCFVHKLRTVQKHVRYIKLSSRLPGCDKEIYSIRLSSAVRARVRLELVRVKKFYKTAPMFVAYAEIAVKNILHCFSGNHINCIRNSMVCNAHLLDSYTTNHLPYNKHLELNKTDMLQLQRVLDSDFSRENLRKISRLSTTNRSESLHHRVFTYAPKCTVWSRNFTGLCHSAVHSSSVGTGQSSLSLAARVGIRFKYTDPLFKHMKALDATNSYHLKRKSSQQYKLSRHLARKRRCSQRIKDNSVYAGADASVSNEHAYGININK